MEQPTKADAIATAGYHSSPLRAVLLQMLCASLLLVWMMLGEKYD